MTVKREGTGLTAQFVDSGSILSESIASGGLLSGNIGSGQIGSVHIASGTVVAADVGSGAISSGRIGDAAVVAGSIASGQIMAGHIGSGAIQSGALASGIVPATTLVQFGNTVQVPGGGSLQLQGPGATLAGLAMIQNSMIEGASLAVNSGGENDYNLEIRINGSGQVSLPLTSGSMKVFSNSLSTLVSGGDIVTTFVVRTSGAGPSTFTEEAALVKFRNWE